MPVRLRHQEDKVWLDGVIGWSPREKVSSIHAAQEAAMRAAGEDVHYDDLVGVSGLAFRMQIHQTALCPSSPHAFCGSRCVDRSVRSLPRQTRIFDLRAAEEAEVRRIRQTVIESIERGVPVQYGNEEDGVVIGYQKGGEEWICLHPYREGGRKSFVESALPWGIAVFTTSTQPAPSPQGLAVEAIRHAVSMADAGEAEGYWVGFSAWQEYVERLKGLETASEEARHESMLGNAWIYECLTQHRSCAATYLDRMAGEIREKSAAGGGTDVVEGERRDAAAIAEQLEDASQLYRRMATQVLTDPASSAPAVAPYPWSLPEGKTWSTSMRHGQISRLEEAFSLERRAVSALEQVLPRLS